MSELLAEIPIDVDALARLESEAAVSTDLKLKTLLIETLADRCVSIGCEKYFERLRQHTEDLPSDHQHFPLAFLAALEGRSDEACQHFVRYTARIVEGQKAPPDSDFAWRFGQRLNCIVCFLDDAGADALWNSVSAIFAEKWPSAPISVFYEVAATPANGTDEEAQGRLWKALSNAPDFWMASLTKALVHIDNEEWKAAARCFDAVGKHKTARRDPTLCYEAACAFLKADRRDDAKEALVGYLECLELASGESVSPSADAVCLVARRLSQVDWVDEVLAGACLETLASAARDRWGEKACSLYLLGSVLLNEDDTEGALSHFVRANSLDKTFWLAALAAARVYTTEDNWKSAAGWFRHTLQAEGARLYADVWFEVAWCFGRAKSREEEIDAYRRCLECIPDYRYGTNNLGWALLKAGKYEEAVDVLRRAMQLETDRRYAIANLARALRKLGRYQEAIDVLSEDKTQKGTVRKRSLRQIAKLEELLKSKPEPKEDMHARAGAPVREQQVPLSEPEEADEGDEQEEEEGEDEQGPDIAEVTKEAAARLTPTPEAKRKRPKEAPLEKILESLIEEKILRGDAVFNRKLRMYESDDRLYGRQFPVPEIGFIDLLAVDVERGDLVVIELKRAGGTREVIGQVSEYVGWVKENLAEPDQQVVPVICLHTAKERLRAAAEAIGIEVFEYDLSFRRVAGV